MLSLTIFFVYQYATPFDFQETPRNLQEKDKLAVVLPPLAEEVAWPKMLCCKSYKPDKWRKNHTVDGRNPAPVEVGTRSLMVVYPIISLFTGFYTSQVVSRISSITSIVWSWAVGVGPVREVAGCWHRSVASKLGKGWQKRGAGDCDGVGPWGLKLSTTWRLKFWLPDLAVYIWMNYCCFFWEKRTHPMMLLEYGICPSNNGRPEA